MSEFVNGAFWLDLDPPSPTSAAYGRSQDLGETLLLTYGSADLHANFISLPAICSLAHGDI
jgi:hypothetical protein